MKLAHINLEEAIEFNEEKIISWVIEDSQIFWTFVKELLGQYSGEEGRFVLSKSLKNLKIESETEMIAGPFDISFNSKKITSLVTKRLSKVASENDYIVKFQEISRLTKSYLSDLVWDADLPIKINDIQEDSLIKLADYQFEESNLFYDNLINYIKLILNLNRPKLLVLINLKSYIYDENFDEFLKFLQYEDINVLFIDLLTDKNKLIKCGTKTYFLDNDCCEFVFPCGHKIDAILDD